MKALKVLSIIASTILVIITLSILVFRVTDLYLPWQEYNEYRPDKFFVHESDLEEYIETKVLEPVFVKANDTTFLLPLDSIVDSADVSISSQSNVEWFFGTKLNYEVEYTFNDDELHEKLLKEYQPCTDASIAKSNNGFAVIEANTGLDYDVDEVLEYLKENIVCGVTLYDISEFCKTPTYTTEQAKLDYSDIAWLDDWQIEYTNNMFIGKDFVIDSVDTTTLTISENSIELEAFIDYLSKDYTTVGDTTNFKTTASKNISVVNKTFGYTVDTEAEKEFILQALRDRKSYTDREPITKGYGKLGNTYVEVSIEDQHLWHYVDGVLCCDTDIVTGTKNVHNTPKGLFYVSECINGKYLRGTGYTTWVNKWMRLTNSGVGLHDAGWRSSFGGNIYTYNGSHGCINLPKQFACILYTEMQVGEPVVIY